MKDFWVKAWWLVCVMAYAIGTIAGVGNCLMVEEYVAAGAIVINGVLAWPVVRLLIDKISD